MLAQDKKYQKIHRSALIASLFLHAFFLGFLLYLYHHKHEHAQKKEASIIFMPPEPEEKRIQKDPLLEEWATTRPSFTDPSSSAHSLQDTPPSAPSQEETPASDQEITKEEQVAISDRAVDTPDEQESSLDQATNTMQEDQKAIASAINEPEDKKIDNPSPKKKKRKKQKKKEGSIEKSTFVESKKQAPTFSDLVKGFSTFMEQTKHGAESRIHMLGKDGKKPTDQQLKYERYLERLIITLETSLRTNSPYSTPPAIRQNPRVTMALNRRGILISFKVIESSGSKEVDDHVAKAFYDAGSSFPPVPDYLPGDPFVATFTVLMSARW